MPDQPDHPDQPDRPDPRGPEGDPTRPWEQPSGAWPGWQDSGQAPHPQYPRQNLLPQEVKPGRNRKPLFITIAVVIALVIAGGIAFLVLRDDGEDTREAYCAALRDLTGDGDLMGGLSGADAATADKLKTAMDLAPERRRRRLEEARRRDLVRRSPARPDMSEALSLFSSLRAIADDAQSKCDLDLGIPML